MSIIHVIFPKEGTTLLHYDSTAVVAGRCVHWHFHRHRDDVKEVEIRFERESSNYFHFKVWNEEALTKHAEQMDQEPILKETPLARDRCFRIKLDERNSMWAKPHRMAGNNRPKYTVIAYDWQGEEIKELRLDPRIIIDDP